MKPSRVAVTALLLALVAGSRAVSTDTYKAGETFDAVWKIVKDGHFDPAFDVAKWDRVGADLRPKAIEAKTPGEFRAVLADMLGRLGLSHFAVIPSTPDTPGDHAGLNGQPGFDVRLIDTQLVVTSVDAEGGAAAAGVHAGWIVQSIGGTPVSAMLAGLTAENTPPRLAQLQAWRLALPRLRGPSDTSAEVSFIDGTGATVTKSIARKHETGEAVTVGSLPTMFVRVSSSLRTTPAGRRAGVIGFNVWMTAVDPQFQKAMDEFRGADGIVIDLRGNPGGLAAMIMGLAGHFVTERATLGVMKARQAEMKFPANPRLVNGAGERVEPYAGPVAILVDGMTGSASECFSGGLQSLGRARIFGQTTMGQALPALFDRLPNGDVLIHAWGDFVTGTGVRIEGRGVVPDEPIAVTRESLLAGRDATLDGALAWIDRVRKDNRNSK